MLSTIKSSREIDRVFREATRITYSLGAVLVVRTPEGRGPEGRVAFVAGKRVGGAVARNRAKRVLRAAIRTLGQTWPGWDVVVLANNKTGAAGAQGVGSALSRVLSKSPMGAAR